MRLAITIGRHGQPPPIRRPGRRAAQLEILGNATRSAAVRIRHVKLRSSRSLHQKCEPLTIGRNGRAAERAPVEAVPQLRLRSSVGEPPEAIGARRTIDDVAEPDPRR